MLPLDTASTGVVGSTVNAVSTASLGVQLGVALGVACLVVASVTPAVVVSNNKKGGPGPPGTV